MESDTTQMEHRIGPFVNYLQGKNKEESTIRMYAAEIRSFFRWMVARGLTLSEVREGDILHACHQLHGAGSKQATINKSISILSSYFRWAMQQGYVSSNPAGHIRSLDEEKTDPPRWLTTEEESCILLEASKERNWFRKSRNEALIHVMLYAGLRVEEVTYLRLDSLLDETLIVYDHLHESRRVPINEVTQQKLLQWVEVRQQWNKGGYRESPYLFVTERSAYMQVRAIQFVVESFSDRLGFPVLTRYFRHTYCRRLVERGMPIERIQAYAGHKTLATTYRYVHDERW